MMRTGVPRISDQKSPVYSGSPKDGGVLAIPNEDRSSTIK